MGFWKEFILRGFHKRPQLLGEEGPQKEDQNKIRGLVTLTWGCQKILKLCGRHIWKTPYVAAFFKQIHITHVTAILGVIAQEAISLLFPLGIKTAL